MAAVVEKKDEKVEKRRALGRGLASLLPGPRVVPSGERVPTRERNDLPESGASAADGSRAASPLLATDARNGAPEVEPHLPRNAPDAASTSDETGGKRTGVSALPADNTNDGQTEVPRSARDDKQKRRDDKEESRDDGGGGRGHGAVGLNVDLKDDLNDDGGEGITIQAAAVGPNTVTAIDISLIDRNPYQTRYIFDEDLLKELAESIKTSGVVQPIVVRPGETAGRYVLVLGERRLRASKLAGKATVPALVRRLSPQQAAEMTVLENIQRQDLNAIEQAEAFRVLSNEFNLTQLEIAQRIGVSRETVSNYMRLLRLPEETMQLMLDGHLTFSEAREILSLSNDAHIPMLAKEVAEKHLKWDELEERVRELNGFVAMQKAEGWETKAAARRSARWMDPNVRAAQRDMETTLGMKVRIKDRNGKGKITIEYASVDDYQLLMEMLRGKKK